MNCGQPLRPVCLRPYFCRHDAGGLTAEGVVAGFAALAKLAECTFCRRLVALLGDDNEQLAAASAGEIKALLQQHGIDDAQLVRLLDEYEHWLYAAEPPAARVQRRWLRQVRRAAARYRRSARQAV